jgi:hypothetical protein
MVGEGRADIERWSSSVLVLGMNYLIRVRCSVPCGGLMREVETSSFFLGGGLISEGGGGVSSCMGLWWRWEERHPPISSQKVLVCSGAMLFDGGGASGPAPGVGENPREGTGPATRVPPGRAPCCARASCWPLLARTVGRPGSVATRTRRVRRATVDAFSVRHGHVPHRATVTVSRRPWRYDARNDRSGRMWHRPGLWAAAVNRPPWAPAGQDRRAC